MASTSYLGLLLLGTVAYVTLTDSRRTEIESLSHRLVTAEQELTRITEQVTFTEQQSLEATRRVQGSRVLSQRPRWTTLLRLMTQAVGPDMVLRNVKLRIDGQTASRVVVDLEGIAPGPAAVSSLALKLEALELFDRVELGSTRREPYRAAVATSFSLRCVFAQQMQAVAELAEVESPR